MRTAAVVVLAAGLALTACGEPEPAGGALPPPSEVTGPTDATTATTTVTTTTPAYDGPADPAAEIRPDLMVVSPNPVGVGGVATVTFPGGRQRGVAYVLERRVQDQWIPEYFMSAATDGYGGEPATWPVDAEGFGWVDIGIEGSGPDTLVIPESATDGEYRICTANSLENICAEIEIVPSDEAPIPVEPDGGIGDGAAPPTTIEPLPTGAASVVGVYAGVEFYPACGDEQLEYDGVVWYQVQEFDYPEVYDRAVNGDREQAPDTVTVHGLAARVAAPGPGDDVGTLVVWSDGVAYFVSDSGDLHTWLVREELTYDWVC